jgi:hypothetical protein
MHRKRCSHLGSESPCSTGAEAPWAPPASIVTLVTPAGTVYAKGWAPSEGEPLPTLGVKTVAAPGALQL